jgi:hypothetical protein
VQGLDHAQDPMQVIDRGLRAMVEREFLDRPPYQFLGLNSVLPMRLVRWGGRLKVKACGKLAGAAFNSGKLTQVFTRKHVTPRSNA